eukprot:scaffold26602_cov98-Cylindrotheca_fusiformis.AAC.1
MPPHAPTSPEISTTGNTNATTTTTTTSGNGNKKMDKQIVACISKLQREHKDLKAKKIDVLG